MSSPSRSNPALAAAFTMKQCRRNKKQKTTPRVEEEQVVTVGEEEEEAVEEEQVVTVGEEEEAVEEEQGTADPFAATALPAFTLKQCRRNKKRKTKTVTPLVEEKEKPLECLHDGDILCSTISERNLLVCADDNTLIPAAQVLSKSVGLLFVTLYNDEEPNFLYPLVKVYNQIQQTHPQAFEVVFVPIFPEEKNNNIPPRLVPLKERYLFHLHLSRIPWPAIPLDDHSNWRTHLIQRYNQLLYTPHQMLIFDPSGTRLSNYRLKTLTITHGPEIFPFTKERRKQITDQYVTTYLQSNSLQSILGDVLVTTTGQQNGKEILLKTLPTSQIEGKVIGLYFYHGIPLYDDHLLHSQFLTDLEKCCRKTKRKFEVVFINLDHEGGFRSQESFNSFLRNHPWMLALPFEDRRIRGLTCTLDRVHIDCDRTNIFTNSMVIVGARDHQDGNTLLSFNPFGYEIIKEYGYKAYPFTRERVVEMEKERMTHKVTISGVLEASKTEFLVLSGTGEPKHVSYLENKRVILLFLRHLPSLETSLKAIRKLRDIQKSLGDNSFQVVVLDEDLNEKDLDALFRNILPKKWLRFPTFYNYKKIDNVGYFLEKNLKLQVQNEIFLGFDENGCFLKMGSLGLLSASAGFPFIKDKLYNRVFRRYLIKFKDWILEEDGY